MRRASLALLLFTVGGCGHIDTYKAVFQPVKGPTGAEPQIVFEGRPPPRPFSVVALVQAVGYGSNANPEDLIVAIKAQGASLGCDGLLRVRVDQGYTMAQAFGVCVRWTGSASTISPVPPPAPATEPPPVSPAAPVPPSAPLNPSSPQGPSGTGDGGITL